LRDCSLVAGGVELRAMPTSLDNGRRSPRKLLRSVVARLFGRTDSRHLSPRR